MGAIIDRFIEHGVRLELADGGKVRAIGTITEDMRAEIRSSRTDILAELFAAEALDRVPAMLEEFDSLIDQYCALACTDPGQRNIKRIELMAIRRRMAPARISDELIEFRSLVS